ncbi:MAG: cation transporter, partial [Spirochaetales bacterium]|nr:cation transporter [Spirochaetales bacterium]
MAFSLVAKIVYGIFARKEGKKIRSTALVVSGTDSLGDSLVELSILVGIGLQKILGFNVEDYLCILIALMIIHTGYGIMRQCLNRILGMRVDPEFGKGIRKMIILQDGVQNVSNLVIHDYGEGAYIGSVDIEVDENLKASEIGSISSIIKQKAKDMGLVLTSVGVGAVNAESKQVDNIQDKVLEIV